MEKMTYHSNPETNLVWLDLEMTGLDPEKDYIIEVATIVTDGNLNVIEEGPVFAIHQDEVILKAMDSWNQNCHTATGLIERVKKSTISVENAEAETLTFIKKHVAKGASPLCGNSIEHDRRFIIKYMPDLHTYMHFRHINVSTVKELIGRWYPDSPQREFPKKQTHQALDDIRESIDEMKHYRRHFFLDYCDTSAMSVNRKEGERSPLSE